MFEPILKPEARRYSPDFLRFIKVALPCWWRGKVATPCSLVIEADHAGPRGVGRKSHDEESYAACTDHHRGRTDFNHGFETWDGDRMAAELAAAVDFTQARYRAWVRNPCNF